MPARVFEDSTGAVWEVFEVQRSSQKAQAVSAGLEGGWLAFVCGSTKRRLAPYPKDWQAADSAELERLCGRARSARPSTASVASAPSAQPADTDRESRTRVPRIRPPRGEVDSVASQELPIVATATSADSVEDTVREFAHQARSHRLPAIEAMVRMKALLNRVYTEPNSAARDLRAVRRWFVEAYYFERDATPADLRDQSR